MFKIRVSHHSNSAFHHLEYSYKKNFEIKFKISYNRRKTNCFDFGESSQGK